MIFNIMVCVLLSTYNGEKYLEEQLNSLIKQEDVELRILVRDDGSKDRTHEILDKWQKQGHINWYEGKNMGAAQSFMDLIYNAPEADHYAFCDQDDVWLPEKLKVAIDKIKEPNEAMPCMYISSTFLVDKQLQRIGVYKVNSNFSFGESLVRNSATGCTLVMNKKLFEKIREQRPEYISMHDSWTYRVCLALGGKVIYDPTPHILYRQHECNVVGGKKSISKIIKRRYLTLTNKIQGERLQTCKCLLKHYGNEMSITNRFLLGDIVNYRESVKSKFRILFSPLIKLSSLKYRFYFVTSILLNRF